MDFPELDRNLAVGLDCESSSLRYWEPDFQVFGLAVAQGEHSWYWDLRQTPQAIEWAKDQLPGMLVSAHFAQFDYQCLRRLGINPRSISWHCSMVTETLIDEHQLTYDLESTCIHNGIVSRKREHLEAIRVGMGWDAGVQVQSRLAVVPPALVRAYGASDARDTLEVYIRQMPQVREQELGEVYKLESQLIPVLADMSFGGIRVDLEAAHAAIPKLDIRADELQKEINTIAGRPFNVNSTPQIRDFFKPEQISKFQWKLIEGTLVGPTKGGKGPSMGQEVLRDIQHPLAQKISSLRKVIKLRDTFLRGHIIGSADNQEYVHTTFNQSRNDADAGTITGRLSSTDPALQQITKRDKEFAALLRAMFLGDEGDDWFCADYSQVDFRCGAHLQNIDGVIKAYWDNPKLDYHQIVSNMTGIPRNAPYAGAPYTKQINLGLSFGAGPGKLAFMMKMPYTIAERRHKMIYIPGSEAEAIFQKYHAMLPGVKKFMEHATNVAKDTGFVRTAIGRRLRYRRHGHHRAAGHLYQAYAADLHKVGLVEVDRVIQENRLPARLMMSCHDEIGVSMKRDEETARILTSRYTDFNSENSRIQMRIPIIASAKFGTNWWEACKEE